VILIFANFDELPIVIYEKVSSFVAVNNIGSVPASI